ncbi:transposase [Amycolatopsis sp. NPDC059021]|uniref:IS66 family transposase n=1 Tax=Amycolatopsis sp. NPDC059021 TaxID=3346704 RepID=UPI00366EFE15
MWLGDQDRAHGPGAEDANTSACYGPNVTALAVYLPTYQHIPAARTARLLADMLGLPVSTGWVAGVLAPVASEPDEFAECLVRQLRGTPVAHFGETGLPQPPDTPTRLPGPCNGFSAHADDCAIGKGTDPCHSKASLCSPWSWPRFSAVSPFTSP